MLVRMPGAISGERVGWAYFWIVALCRLDLGRLAGSVRAVGLLLPVHRRCRQGEEPIRVSELAVDLVHHVGAQGDQQVLPAGL